MGKILFATLFGAPISNIIAASESVAPYYYHKAKKGATSTVVLSILQRI